MWAHVVVSLVYHFLLWKWGEKISILTNKKNERIVLSLSHLPILLVMSHDSADDFYGGSAFGEGGLESLDTFFYFGRKKKMGRRGATLIIFRLFEMKMKYKKHQYIASC